MIIAYHCRHCGAPVDPEQEICGFCKKPIHHNGEEKRRLVRVLSKDLYGEDCDYVYFDEVTTISGDSFCDEIINTSSNPLDEYKRTTPIGTYGEKITMTLPKNKRGFELALKLHHGAERFIRMEIGNLYCMELKVHVGVMNNDNTEYHVEFYRESNIKQYHLELPKGITCPNCGGLLKSRYGACDFCNGWVEFIGE